MVGRRFKIPTNPPHVTVKEETVKGCERGIGDWQKAMNENADMKLASGVCFSEDVRLLWVRLYFVQMIGVTLNRKVKAPLSRHARLPDATGLVVLLGA
jgi:hypothetical protein